jgi:hypothetical protein
MPGKISAPELLLLSPARSDSHQKKGVTASSQEWLENSAPESASRSSRYKSLKLKRERSKDFQGKIVCELAVWDKNKRSETWQSPEKTEMKAVEPGDFCQELTVTVDSKASEDFEATHLQVEELAAPGDLGVMHVDFCNTQVDPAHRSPTALSQKEYEENSLSPIGCNTSTLSDFEPISSFSEFPLDSPQTLVLNFGIEGKHNSSDPRSGRITSNYLKTGLPIENIEHGLGGLEGTHQALDLLAGGMLPEEEETLKKQESLRLESETITHISLGPSPCLPDLVDFVTRTSVAPKEKLCSPLSEPDDCPKCSSLELGPLQLEIPNASIPEIAVPQAVEDNDDSLNLVKTPTSRIVGGNMVPQEMPEQEVTVDAIQDHTESSVHD